MITKETELSVDGMLIKRLRASHRLIDNEEFTINATDLCQQYDINIDIHQPKRLNGEGEHTYYLHTVDSLLHEIEKKFNTSEINKICLHISGGEMRDGSFQEKINRQAGVVKQVKSIISKKVDVYVDILDVGLHSNMVWGVKNEDGDIDLERSLQLVSDTSYAFGEAGVDYLMTIGRINYEVYCAHKSIKQHGFNSKVASFSSNSESPLAYFQDNHDPKKAKVGQQLISGNVNEMVIRTLFDFLEGSVEMIQKPMTNMLVTKEISLLLSGLVDIKKYIETDSVKNILSKSDNFAERMNKLIINFESIRVGKKLSGYVISGSYAIYKLVEATYGSEVAFSVLKEDYTNFKAAAGNYFNTIIDRNALWYIANSKIYN